MKPAPTAVMERLCNVVERLARWLAIAGGSVLIALITTTLVSIFGRSLTQIGLGPVPGDYELVEMGSAFAILAFLPWCQLRQGHVSVDILTRGLSPRAIAALSLFSNSLMTLVAILLASRMIAGMLDKMRYGETTFILQVPVWWGYAAGLIGAWLFVLACLVTVWRSLCQVSGHRPPSANGSGATPISGLDGGHGR